MTPRNDERIIDRTTILKIVSLDLSKHGSLSTHARLSLRCNSKCSPDLLFFHAVQMEMYYNNVFAEDQGLNNSFYFRFVIPRGNHALSSNECVPNKKSLQRVHNVLELSYRNIVIVDDAGDLVWNSEIPDQFIDESTVNL